MDRMSIQPVTSKIPAGPVAVAAVGAQLVDDVVFFLVPPVALALGPLAGLLAIALTAAGARAVTRGRTGLALGLASAGIGLLIGGLGLVTLLLAGITVLAGVAGAVAGRGLTATRLP